MNLKGTFKTKCKSNLKHLPNVNDIHYIGDNNNANSLFNTTKTKGSNLIECTDNDCKLKPGTTGPNGFKCVSNPLGWNHDTNSQWWYAKTDDTSNNDWTWGKKCLAAFLRFQGTVDALYKYPR